MRQRFKLIKPTKTQAFGGTYLIDTITKVKTPLSTDKKWISKIRRQIKCYNFWGIIHELYKDVEGTYEMTIKTFGVFQLGSHQVYKIKVVNGLIVDQNLLFNGGRYRLNKFLKSEKI